MAITGLHLEKKKQMNTPRAIETVQAKNQLSLIISLIHHSKNGYGDQQRDFS